MNEPYSCDCLVALPNATKSGQTIFAKNSDRPRYECQPLVQRECGPTGDSGMARCQFVHVPQTETVFKHAGSRPHWCWGYEHGFNEYQVVIGNEAVASKIPEAHESKLIGMEMIRLGLERSRTASEAVEVMTALAARYGQGKFGTRGQVRTYDNSFIIADPREAWVLEMAGHEWAVKRVESTVGISNIYSIGDDWDSLSPLAEQRAVKQGWWDRSRDKFNSAEAYCDVEASIPGRGTQRSARSRTILDLFDGDIDVKTMMHLLGDHSDGETPDEPFQSDLSPVRTICTHYDDASDANTATSLVADLCSNGSRLPIYWYSLYSPCVGIFMPLFLEGQIPVVLSVGNENPDGQSPWWLFQRLELVARRSENGYVLLKDTWESAQEDLLRSAYLIAEKAGHLVGDDKQAEACRMLTDYMHKTIEFILCTAQTMLSEMDDGSRVLQ